MGQKTINAILLKLDEENSKVKIFHESVEKEFKVLDYVMPYAKKIALDSKVNITLGDDDSVKKIVSDSVTTGNNYHSNTPKPAQQELPQNNAAPVIKGKTNRNNLNIHKKFIVNIQGKEFITYNGLLAYAQENGEIEKKEVLRLDVSDDQKLALAHVRVTMKDGRFFEDIGSCTPQNSKSVTTYAPEMAVTRGYARAIRTGLNVDYCSKEEIS